MDALVEISAFENAPCGYIVYDESNAIIEANPRICDWLDRSKTELVGSPIMEIFSKASRIVVETSMIPLLDVSQQVDGVSLDLLRQDGSKHPVLVSAEKLQRRQTTQTHIVLLSAGGRRNYERDLAEARAKAEAQLAREARERELREQFVAVLGHDLRNPLASMASAIRILSRSATSQRERFVADQATDSVKRMAHLIDNTLDFARVRLGKGLELDFSDHAKFEEQINLVVSELASTNPERQITLDMRLDRQPVCDIWRIGQLLSNLLANALFHGETDEPVTAHVVCNDTTLKIEVTNKGKPIPPEILGHLFEPYWRPKTSSRHGLGLGLFIVSEIAKAHGGDVTVMSNENETVFCFQMPCGWPNDVRI